MSLIIIIIIIINIEGKSLLDVLVERCKRMMITECKTKTETNENHNKNDLNYYFFILTIYGSI
jgi:hypothetical protein